MARTPGPPWAREDLTAMQGAGLERDLVEGDVYERALGRFRQDRIALPTFAGRADPTRDRAVWPSTGNYCRGGVAISRLMDCRGVAVLPEGMSRERFDWLEHWVTDPSDIIRTPGTESNVKEIYDKCAELSREPDTVILNQFAEFGNHIIHRLCTGRALERVFESLH